MVYIKFKIDNNDNDGNKDSDTIGFEYDSSKTFREMLIDFVKQKNSYLKIASSDIDSFEKSLSPDLLIFMIKNKILNKGENAKKKISDIIKTNNNVIKIIDAGSILGGFKNQYSIDKSYMKLKN